MLLVTLNQPSLGNEIPKECYFASKRSLKRLGPVCAESMGTDSKTMVKIKAAQGGRRLIPHMSQALKTLEPKFPIRHGT